MINSCYLIYTQNREQQSKFLPFALVYLNLASSTGRYVLSLYIQQCTFLPNSSYQGETQGENALQGILLQCTSVL